MGLVAFLRMFTKSIGRWGKFQIYLVANVNLMAVMTAVVSISAFRRMWMYIDAFGLTNRRMIALDMITMNWRNRGIKGL